MSRLTKSGGVAGGQGSQHGCAPCLEESVWAGLRVSLVDWWPNYSTATACPVLAEREHASARVTTWRPSPGVIGNLVPCNRPSMNARKAFRTVGTSCPTAKGMRSGSSRNKVQPWVW